MSYLFNGVDDSLLVDSTGVTTVPLTLACWFYSTDSTVNQNLVNIVDKDADTDYFSLSASGNVAGDPVRAGSSMSGTTQFAATTTSYTTGAWQHACAVFSSQTLRAAYLNGGGKGTEATSIVPANLDRTGVGRLVRLTPGGTVAGYVAEVAIWSIALTDSEIAYLAAGGKSSVIQRRFLIDYWPLVNNVNDSIGGRTFTISGASQNANHPSIYGAGGSVLTPEFDPTGVLG